MSKTASASSTGSHTIVERFMRLNWPIITLLILLAVVGVTTHFSVSGDGMNSLPLNHGMRFVVLLAGMILLAIFIDAGTWIKLAYPLYGAAFVMLVLVWAFGAERNGAQSWIDLGPVSFQPSELMKVAVVLALARYYQQLDPRRLGMVIWTIPPLVMVAAPVGFVMVQPDLGTGMLILIAGAVMMFLGGLMWRVIAAGAILGGAGAVFVYNSGLLAAHQIRRINEFLGIAEDDIQGAGYQLFQSKVAIGSAGLFGRGYRQGVQAQGDFLPEKDTDFVYTMIVEEWGFIGGVIVLALYGLLMYLAIRVAMRSRNLFSKLVAGGVAATLASYVFINTAMVMGLAPVVGIPLPLVSFGGTAMVTIMACFAIVLSVDLHRDQAGARGIIL